MKKLSMGILAGLLILTLAGAALAAGLPGMDALIQVAKSAKPTPLTLPEVFSLTYRTAEGEVSLSRGADGALVAVRGEETYRFELVGENLYKTAEGDRRSLDEIKKDIAFVWDLVEPTEQVENAAVIVMFDANTKALGRDANRFRQSTHEGTETGYSVDASKAVWYTFDKKTGVCLMKETAADENHENAEVVYECVAYTE